MEMEILAPHPPFHMTHCCRGYRFSSPKLGMLLVKSKNLICSTQNDFGECSQSSGRLPLPASVALVQLCRRDAPPHTAQQRRGALGRPCKAATLVCLLEARRTTKAATGDEIYLKAALLKQLNLQVAPKSTSCVCVRSRSSSFAGKTHLLSNSVKEEKKVSGDHSEPMCSEQTVESCRPKAFQFYTPSTENQTV